MYFERRRVLSRSSVGRAQRECSVMWDGIPAGREWKPLSQMAESYTCVTELSTSSGYNRMPWPVSSESRPIEDENLPAYNPEQSRQKAKEDVMPIQCFREVIH